MNKKTKSTLNQSISALGISLGISLAVSSVAHAEWFYGIGTGLSMMNINGQQGFNTIAGPVKYDVKLDPEDFSDITKSAFGFGGYATDGTYLVQYSLANIELEDEESTAVGASTVTTKINFITRGGEVTVGYPIYKSPSVVAMIDGGVRYTRHQFDNTVTVSGAINAQRNREFSNGWTDAVLGVIVNVPLGPQWTWNNRANGGFGGSDGTYLASTGVTWRFHKKWSSALTAKYMNVKFENGSEGSSDWYFYDAEETSLGLVVLYNW